MNSVEINQLNSQVDQLMHLVNSLTQENAVLRQKMAVHIQEQTRLQHKNIFAAKQIKQIIKQLKEELT
jgi:uncharacterized protein (TIGR02449 family)